MRQKNQRLESGFASQKIALGSTWEAAQRDGEAAELLFRVRACGSAAALLRYRRRALLANEPETHAASSGGLSGGLSPLSNTTREP